jgi:hypothetical protein
LLALGHSAVEASDIAEVAARVLDRPIRAPDHRQRAREIVEFLWANSLIQNENDGLRNIIDH